MSSVSSRITALMRQAPAEAVAEASRVAEIDLKIENAIWEICDVPTVVILNGERCLAVPAATMARVARLYAERQDILAAIKKMFDSELGAEAGGPS